MQSSARPKLLLFYLLNFRNTLGSLKINFKIQAIINGNIFRLEKLTQTSKLYCQFSLQICVSHRKGKPSVYIVALKKSLFFFL